MHNINLLLPKLKESINSLEEAIHKAKLSLDDKDSHIEQHQQRLNSYFSIVNKQRVLIEELESDFSSVTSPSKSDILESGRRINIINALSAMIRDDAHDLMKSILKIKSTNSSTD